MPNPTRANTFADWRQPHYRWEHVLVAFLTGMLFEALINVAVDAFC